MTIGQILADHDVDGIRLGWEGVDFEGLHEYSNFVIDHTEGCSLRIYFDHKDDEPIYQFAADHKVTVKENHLEIGDGMVMYLMESRPIRMG